MAFASFSSLTLIPSLPGARLRGEGDRLPVRVVIGVEERQAGGFIVDFSSAALALASSKLYCMAFASKPHMPSGIGPRICLPFPLRMPFTIPDNRSPGDRAAQIHLIHRRLTVVQIEVGHPQGRVFRHGHFAFLLQSGKLIHRQGVGDIQIATESCRRREALSPIIFTETRLKCGFSPDQCGLGTITSC